MSKRCKGIIYAIKSICFDKLQRHIWFGLESQLQITIMGYTGLPKYFSTKKACVAIINEKDE